MNHQRTTVNTAFQFAYLGFSLINNIDINTRVYIGNQKKDYNVNAIDEVTRSEYVNQYYFSILSIEPERKQIRCNSQ